MPLRVRPYLIRSPVMSALGQKRKLRYLRLKSAYPQKRTWISAVGMSALCQKRTFASSIRSPIKRGALWLLGRPDLRRTHRLGHAEEDRHSLTAAPRRQRLLRVGEAAVDVLPVVHHPHVARG